MAWRIFFVRASEFGSLPLAAAMKERLTSSSGKPQIKLDKQQKTEVKKKINKGLIGRLASGGAFHISLNQRALNPTS